MLKQQGGEFKESLIFHFYLEGGHFGFLKSFVFCPNQEGFAIPILKLKTVLLLRKLKS